MKDIRYVVEDYIKKHKSGKRAFAALVSLSMLVSFAVPMILTEPAVSQTRDSFAPVGDMLATQMFNAAEDHMIQNMNDGVDGNNGNSKGSLSEVALLIGEGHDWVREANCETAADVIEAAKEKFLLGIASDFCVFIEGNFSPHDSDTEGRAAIGGNIDFKGSWNYQFGNGDYTTGMSLGDTDNYSGINNFAHLITNGYIKHVAMLSQGRLAPVGENQKGDQGDTWYYPDPYKRFVVGDPSNENNVHYIWTPDAQEVKYKNGCSHDNYSPNELAEIYHSETPLIDFTSEFQWLRERSDKISKINGIPGTYDSSTGTLTFTYPYPSKKNVNAVYFNLDHWDDGIRNINFEGIPTVTGENGEELCANIVINCGSETVNIYGDPCSDNKHNYTTIKVNGEVISNVDNGNGRLDDYPANNHKYSERILYNFYNATEITINTNFNGTILSPNADAKSEHVGSGHLSGSLIAKSFDGGLEFGYRPYRGSVDILETQMGYVLPFSKVKASDNAPLEDAKFEIKDGDTIISSFTSDGTNKTFVEFPTQIAFDGSKNYQASSDEAIEISKTYTISEVSAPEGYVTDSDTKYEVMIKETICRGHNGDLILTDEGNTIPTHVTSDFTIKNAADENIATFTIELRDYYDTTNNLVRRELTIGEQKICLNIVDGVVDSIEDGNGEVKETKNRDVPSVNEGKVESTNEPIQHSANVISKDENGNILYDTKNIAVGEPETFDITQFGWGSDKGSIKIDSITFYLYDGNFEGHYATFTGYENGDVVNQYWQNINLPPDFDESYYKNVMGVKAVFSSDSTDSYEIVLQKSDGEVKTQIDMSQGNTVVKTWGTIPELPETVEVAAASVQVSEEAPNAEAEQSNGETPQESLMLEAGEFTLDSSTEETETAVQTDAESETAPEQTTGIAVALYANEAPAESTFTVTSSMTSVTVTRTETSTWYEDNYKNVMTQVAVDYYQKLNLDLTLPIITIGGKEYKYEPSEFMVMPIPETVPKFENKRGLVFKKLDNEDKPVSGATIKVYNGETDVSSEVGFDWAGKSSITIDVTKLQAGETYRFVEESAPGGYEKAAPIYFKKVGDKIKYGDSIECTEEIDINSEEIQSIVMTDIKISGAELELKKIDNDDLRVLEGAKFTLYSGTTNKGDDKDGVLVYPMTNPDQGFLVNMDDDVFNLLECIRKDQTANNVNTEYVKDGYLLPGNYFLFETHAPNGYDGTGSEFRFKVNSDYSIETIGTTDNNIVVLTEEDFEVSDKDHQRKLKIPGGIINDVTQYQVQVDNNRFEVQYNKPDFSDGNMQDDSNGKTILTKTLDTPQDFTWFQIQNYGGNLGTITELIIKTESGTTYYYKKTEASTQTASFNAVRKTNAVSILADEAYEIKQIVFNSGSNSKNVKIIVYYADNSSKNFSASLNTWYTDVIDSIPSDDRKNVVGISMQLDGDGEIESAVVIKGRNDTSTIWEGNVNNKEMSSFGSTSGDVTSTNFTVKYDNPVVVDSKVKLDVSGVDVDKIGDIKWDSDSVKLEKGAWYYCAPSKSVDSITITGTYGTGEEQKTGKFTINIQEFAITADRISVTPSGTVNITANAYATWSIENGEASCNPSQGRECDVSISENAQVGSTVIVKATYGTHEKTVNINVIDDPNKIDPNAFSLRWEEADKKLKVQYKEADISDSNPIPNIRKIRVGLDTLGKFDVYLDATSCDNQQRWSGDSKGENGIFEAVQDYGNPTEIKKLGLSDQNGRLKYLKYIILETEYGSYTINCNGVPETQSINLSYGYENNQYLYLKNNGNKIDWNHKLYDVKSIKAGFATVEKPNVNEMRIGDLTSMDNCSGSRHNWVICKEYDTPTTITEDQYFRDWDKGSLKYLQYIEVEFADNTTAIVETNFPEEPYTPPLTVTETIPLDYNGGNVYNKGENSLNIESADKLKITFNQKPESFTIQLNGTEETVDELKLTGNETDGYVYTRDLNGDVTQLKISGTDDIHTISITTADGSKEYIYDSTPAASVNDQGVLIIPNKKAGDKISITGVKEWAGDSNYTDLRPEKVTLTLKRQKLNTDSNTYVLDDSFVETKEVNAASSWKCKWDGLDKCDVNGNPYQYYIDEMNVDDDYEKMSASGFLSNGGGELKVTNTLKTIDITAQKIWDGGTNGGTDYIPESLEVQLQYRIKDSNDDAAWADVTIKTKESSQTVEKPLTVTLTPEGEWKETINALPEKYEYRIVEINVPANWTVGITTIAKNNDDTASITNTLKTGSLEITKNWENDTENDRPQDITVELYRTFKKPTTNTSNAIVGSDAKITQYNDYARLLQYSLYFYDANMCGDDVEGASAFTWRNDCHEDDEVYGGYHDAGDHCMFGITQGFTASTLAWGYYEFQDAYDSLGQTQHLQKVLKRFCDFFVRSTKLNGDTVTDFMYQKGEPTTDHGYNGTPENQSSSQRGKEYWTSKDSPAGASNIAAEYAAALAAYTLCFPNEENNSNYLKYAIALYNFANKKTNVIQVRESNGNNIYVDQSADDDRAWAAVWLYLATENDVYKNASMQELESCSIEKIGYHWGDVNLGAATLYASHIDKNNSAIKGKVTDYLNSYCDASKSDYVILDEWGSARHNALTQQVALSATKNDIISTGYLDWCVSQMKFLLGDNNVANNGNDSTCFVEGFADNSVCHTHHRAGHFEGRNYTLVGALAGGVDNVNNDNTDKTDDYKQNEVTLDYNSGLVGAAAGLYYFKHTGKIVPQSKFENHAELAKINLDAYSFEPTVNVKEYAKCELKYAANNENLEPLVLNLGDERQLIFIDNGTEVAVSLSDTSSEIIEILDAPNGIIRAKKNGTGTLTVNIGGEEKTIKVKVNLNAIPHEVEEIVGIELVYPEINFNKNNDNTWTANVDDLPLYDKYGRRYYYYIKEKTDSTGAIDSYYPTSYEDGKTLSENEPTLMELTNTKADNNGASMPSAGGGGTRGYYVIGMVITCAAGAFMFLRRRRTAK